MPKPLEVRAVMSFGAFRQGKVYEVDIDDDRIMSLLGVGYLEPTTRLEGGDDIESAGMGVRDDVRGADLRDVRVVGSPQAEAMSEEVTDVTDRPGQVGDVEFSAPKRVRGRKTSGVEDPDGGADAR